MMKICCTMYAGLITAIAILVSGCGINGQTDVSRRPYSEIKCTHYGDVNCRSIITKNRNGEPVVEITFSNQSDRGLPLPKAILLTGNEMTWSAFRVLRGPVEVPYQGKTIYRSPLKAREYYLLAPGELLTASIKLPQFYDVSEPGIYRLSYFAIFPLIGGDGLCELKSNWVEFNVD